MDIRKLAKKGLQAELARLDEEREKVLAMLAQLEKSGSVKVAETARKTRKMSAAGRQAIREAVKRRWAAVRAAKAASEAKPTKRPRK